MRTIGVRVKGGGSDSDSECHCCSVFASVVRTVTLPSNEREYDALLYVTLCCEYAFKCFFETVLHLSLYYTSTRTDSCSFVKMVAMVNNA
jgi:hypothetical protein